MNSVLRHCKMYPLYSLTAEKQW